MEPDITLMLPWHHVLQRVLLLCRDFVEEGEAEMALTEEEGEKMVSVE